MGARIVAELEQRSFSGTRKALIQAFRVMARAVPRAGRLTDASAGAGRWLSGPGPAIRF